MSSKTQNKKQASEFEREKKQVVQTEVKPMTFDDEVKQLWKNMMKTASHDLVGGTVGTFSEQIMGYGGTSGQLAEGQAVSLKQQPKHAEAASYMEKKPATSSEHMEYFRTVNNADKVSENRTEQQMTQAVEQIRIEIQKLIKTSKLVERTVKDATADKAPIKPGKYHISFFEFVLGTLREATKKLEDTASFGAVFQSKKQQSKYWKSYKKHGTSFGLSGERTVATQTG